MNRIRRWGYALLTIRSYAERLNRWSDVESALRQVAAGKRGPLTPEECLKLANKLGIPEHDENTVTT
jgi:hypothetical protein